MQTKLDDTFRDLT